MDNEFFREKYELSRSSFNNMHFAGTDARAPTKIPEAYNIPNLQADVGQIPLFLATPPQSPHEPQQEPMVDMPSLRAMLANNLSQFPPTGYIVHIPCFLCKQPFSDIDSLRDHLTMHASHLNIGIGATPVVAPPKAQLLPPAVRNQAVTPPAPSSTDLNKQNQEEATITCDLCGTRMRSETCLYLHKKMHHNLQMQCNKGYSKGYRCHLCKKSYRREGNLLKHMEIRHRRHPFIVGFQPELTTAPAQSIAPTQQMPPAKLTPSAQPMPRPRPTQPTIPAPAMRPTQLTLPMQLTPTAQLTPPALPTPPASVDDEISVPKKKVWSTKLLNAIAAANYNPATESASKYKANNGPSSKQKYALRSPFCNPNLWVDYDNHVP